MRCLRVIVLLLGVGWSGFPIVSALDSPPDLATWQSDHTRLTLDATGALSEFAHTHPLRNCLAPGQSAPLLSLRVAGTLHPPERASWDTASGRLTLRFDRIGATAVVAVAVKPSHVRFELESLSCPAEIELALWGPYPTVIGEVVGETIGVVRDTDTALGIQALNAKTLGGYPTHENDVDPGYSADDPAGYPDLPTELGKAQLWRGNTARHTEFGSVLQAYCRNRTHDRVIANWGHDRYRAPAFDDGGVIGSQIALFACPAPEALNTIGAIEVAEGLPHPLLDGVWAKIAPGASAAYLIVDFGEDTIDRAIEMTRRAGLRYLYHSSPFETWGHFALKPNLFPRGWEGFRVCVDKARAAGVRIGFHTLSNFITPNDPYVTPQPDRRLARIGETGLPAAVDATQTEIPVGQPDCFRQATTLNTVRIGNELIQYGAVSETAPWRLLECRRGSWGTSAAPHAAGEAVAKLMDHAYKVFLSDAGLSQEIARNIARFCSVTGARQLSFDGLEGNWSTGLGQYGRTLFTEAWHDALSPELRGQVINDASNPGHFNWHIYTRMNWGEPWYAGFRESQTLYRFKNQLYFERNLMPRMLGWFALRPDTSLEDAEWLLARAAGFNAGFTLAASLASTAQLEADPKAAEAARRFGAVPTILEAVKQWETARMAGAFPEEVRAALRDNTREFHLEPAGEKRWHLSEFTLERLTHPLTNATPTALRFDNPHAAQPLQFIIRNAGSKAVAGLVVTVDGRPVLDLASEEVLPGGAVRYVGGPEAILCDATWRETKRLPVSSEAARINAGPQELTLGCPPRSEGRLKAEFRTAGKPTLIRSAR
ncbi:MAG: hypothetical protein H7A45_11120 [Verrucomicrobiales bacterium]|nr:hypothetical protein [Verrucomicrobiales bacterium]MCP5526883.1 hypothetical protein [Verrucomicrobiales bacterium]